MISPIYFFTRSGCSWCKKMQPSIEQINDTLSNELADGINSNSLSVIENARVERSLADASGGDIYQFEREGYFVVDTVEYAAGRLVFNSSVSLRDTWARVQRNQN